MITSDLTIPVRDGARLAADLHQPPGEGRRPVLVIRTPYGKQGYRDEQLVAKAVERGYAVVVQDVRGRYASDGVFDPYKHEGLDGYDTIEWLARQPWSTGKIATAEAIDTTAAAVATGNLTYWISLYSYGHQ